MWRYHVNMERKESFQHPDESLKAKRDAISQKNHLKSVITNQKLMTIAVSGD